jgi:hypothetical protein
VVKDIRELSTTKPFIPFTIHLVAGGGLRIPTVDHVYVTPTGNRVFVSFDDGTYDVIRPLMISRVTVDREGASSDS